MSPVQMFLVRCLLILATVLAANAEVTTTVIDLLSENVEFSSFLRLLQRNQLIPFLNEFENFTLIAPVNSAFFSARGSFSVEDLSHYIISSPIDSNLSGSHIFKSENINESPILAQSNKTTFQFNGIDVVEKDLYAESQNAYVQGIDRLISYNSFESIIGSHKFSTFRKLLGDRDVSNNTVLLPTNEAFGFEDHELNYLLSDFGKQDTQMILNSLLIPGFYGGDDNKTAVDTNNYTVSLSSDGVNIVINGTLTSTHSNGLTSSTVFHVFDDSSLVQRVEFNALKYLVGLGAESFVKELISQELSHLITDNLINQTIFYFKDSDDISVLSKSSNLYHFVEERIPDLSVARNIYNTRYCSSKKFGDHDCQKIKIDSIGENSYMINNNILVEAGPYEVGNTVIYLTDEPVSTPGNILSSVNPVFHCSKSLNYFYELGLTKLSNNNKGYSIFMPCFESYDDYELTLNYFENDKSLLTQIMKNFILEGLVYTDVNPSTSLTLSNLNDENVTLDGFETDENNFISFNFNNESILTIEKSDDILFNQGVIHPVDKFYLPSSVEISLFDIVDNSDSTPFLDLFKIFPELDEILHDVNDLNYSLLSPLTSSFLKLDPFNSNNTLKEFLQMHIIPYPTQLYDCEDVVQTLNPKVNLTCQIVSHPRTITLHLSDNTDHGVRVLQKGCVSSFTKSCVYSIDKPINPKWLIDNTHLHVRLPAIALGLGILLGSLLMVIVLTCLMLVILKKRKDLTEDSEDSEQTADENSPLINDESREITTRNFESGYSGNSNVEPINVSRH